MSTENANPNPKPMPVVAPDKVVITVGDVKITAAQFDMIINTIPEQSRASARGGARKLFADQLVRVLILAQEGKRRKLDDDPNYKVQTLVHGANLLAGLTFEQLNQEVKISEADVRSYYQKHISEFEMVHARHLLVRAQGSNVPLKPGQKDLSDAEALARAQDLRKKIEGGTDFATLAATESDDPQTASKGGDLGFFRKGQMFPTFEEAAFSMKAGELSQPVKTQIGYHLIKVEAKATSKSFEEARADLERRMRPEMAAKSMADLEKKSSVSLDPEFFGQAK